MQTSSVSEQLQEGELSIAEAVDLIAATKANENWQSIWSAIYTFVSQIGIDGQDVNASLGSGHSKRV